MRVAKLVCINEDFDRFPPLRIEAACAGCFLGTGFRMEDVTDANPEAIAALTCGSLRAVLVER